MNQKRQKKTAVTGDSFRKNFVRKHYEFIQWSGISARNWWQSIEVVFQVVKLSF